jgi:hypothetical protein
MTPERARSFVMPFGKYATESLDAVAAHDPGYIDWLARCTNGSVQRAARGYLELCLESDRN